MINDRNKSKVFLLVIAILLIANIGMLIFFLQKKGPGNDNGRPDKKTFIVNLLKNEIGFSAGQLVQYDTLSSRHRQKVGGLYENIRNNKVSQFKKLAAADFSDSSISEVVDQSTTSQKIVEINMFNHIRSVRQICTAEQLPKFDSLFVKIFNWRDEARKKAGK
ncbi:MAG: hypothetical protein ABIQ31_03100 [Ferruginibacter sp.]